MKRHHTTILVVSLCMATLSVLYFVVLRRSSYRPSETLTVEKEFIVETTNQVIDLDVRSSVWADVSPTNVQLFPQSARVAYGQEEKDILVRAVHNREEIAFLLEFDDESENIGGLIIPDACAILLAPDDATATAQMMGYESKVNIWHWSADRNDRRYGQDDQSVQVVRELISEGPTTQKPLAEQYVTGKGEYARTRWRVVFKRKLAKEQPDELKVSPDTRMQIAFAVWDGGKKETFSRKSISILRPLIISRK